MFRSSEKMMALSPNCFRWLAPGNQCLVGPIMVLFVVFLCSGFRLPFNPLLCFITVFIIHVSL